MTKTILTTLILLTLKLTTNGQSCTPHGDQVSYGTNDTWIGYVYDNMDRTGYSGYVHEGTAGNPGFDQSFGGSTASYPTNGCPVSTTTFSVRYKLQKTFTAGNYTITVGGDDGYRLSIDGGSTWVIDRLVDQSYSTTSVTLAISGLKSLVLDYYENSGDNRISFAISATCSGVEDQSVYGTSNVWNGYLYDGTAFNVYAGKVTQGVSSSSNFDQSFGGSNVSFATSGCPVQTETFSARYRLTRSYVNRSVSFTVGADDGFRLSLDGGATWVIDRWATQSYTSQSFTCNLNGTYSMVLEYYENTGDNRISFSSVENIVLPLSLTAFTGKKTADGVRLDWKVLTGGETLTAEPQRSEDGLNFMPLANIKSPATEDWQSSYTDKIQPLGRMYYRLKLTSASQQVTYSPVVAFTPTGTSGNELLLYPSTISPGAVVNLVSPRKLSGVRISISDLSGKVLSTTAGTAFEAGQAVVLPTAKLPLSAGLHLVTITDDNGLLVTRKLLVR